MTDDKISTLSQRLDAIAASLEEAKAEVSTEADAMLKSATEALEPWFGGSKPLAQGAAESSTRVKSLSEAGSALHIAIQSIEKAKKKLSASTATAEVARP